MEKSLWIWVIFLSVVTIILALDLGVFNRKAHVIGTKEGLWMSLFYIVIGLLFSFWILYLLGLQSFSEYLTGFIVEKTLSLDNILIISLIFTGLSIPRKHQHRVLFFGILGVIILRGLMIALGAKLIERFEWVLYLFAIFMVFTGIKMLFTKPHKKTIEENPFLILMRKYLPITKKIYGKKFFIKRKLPGKKKYKLYLTPLFLALVVIEFTDLIFAVDSVPAIFAITQEPYVVYTSNIFAILGLRALYFALVAVIGKFYYLKFALAFILIFIGAKIFIAKFMGWQKFPPELSLCITLSLLACGVFYSIYKSKQKAKVSN